MILHAIILGAGKGTRMKSTKVKLLHEAAGAPIINHVIRNLEQIEVKSICLVVGFQSQEMREAVKSKKVDFVVQHEQLGTGHAVMQTDDFFKDKTGTIIIIPGDTPLISACTLNELFSFHKQNKAKITVLSTLMPNPFGYGRIIRDNSGQVLKIVEQKDATEEERKINEINTGVYCVNKDVLFTCLKNVTPNNAQKEYYLTDIIQIAKKKAHPVYSYLATNYKEFQGVNSRKDLADVSSYLFQQKNIKLMEDGVTIIDPRTTYIEMNTSIKADTTVYPGVYMKGLCKIGSNCVIGCNSYLENANIPDNSIIQPCQNVTGKK